MNRTLAKTGSLIRSVAGGVSALLLKTVDAFLVTGIWFLVITPVAALTRLFGRDALNLGAWARKTPSTWVEPLNNKGNDENAFDRPY